VHAIRTEELSRRFDRIVAVEGLTIEVNEGEVFGFLGPNGAGKTTTMRMLCALIAPSGGRAWVAGHALGADAEAIRASIGILTETPGLYDRLTVRENLELFGQLHRLDDLPGRIDKHLGLLGLADRRDHAAGELSKGMRQKLAIARALLHEPPVLFLDEPTAALDPASARVVRDCIAELKGRGRTIFLSTHNLAEAEELCDRIALFKTRLIRVDTLASLRRGSGTGRVVRVRVRGPAAPLVEALAALPDLRNVRADGSDLRVEVDDPEQTNPELVRALCRAGADVCGIEEEQRTLEQVYLEIVGATGEGARGAV
jgi:ABC-2 type transport system ATP-binding protein